MNLYSLSNALAHFMGDPPLPLVEYVESVVARVNVEALTPLERRWLEEAKKEEEL